MEFMSYLIEYLLHILVFNSNFAIHFHISHLLRFSSTFIAFIQQAAEEAKRLPAHFKSP